MRLSTAEVLTTKSKRLQHRTQTNKCDKIQ